MSHDEMTDLLAAEALDLLVPEERRGLVDHLEVCGSCARELSGLRAAAASLAFLPPEIPMESARSQRVRARLLERARNDVMAGGSKAAAGSTPSDDAQIVPRAGRRRLDISGMVGWAVAAGLASLLLTHHTFHRPLEIGWIAASVLGITLAVLGIYVAVLRNRLRRLDGRVPRSDGLAPPAGRRTWGR